MPTPTSTAASRPRSAWLVWPFGVLLLVVCGLVTVGRRPPVFVPPEVNIERGQDHSLGAPAMNPWDAWTGTGDPLMLREEVSVVAVVLLAAFLALALVLVVSRIRARRLARDHADEYQGPERTFDRVAATRAVTDVLDDSLASLAEDPHVDDAIVACWHALEEAASGHGLPRRAAETSTEYAARMAEELGLDLGDARILAGLYREARFSEHEMAPTARDTATRVLHDLRSELAAAPTGSA